jgi:integrase
MLNPSYLIQSRHSVYYFRYPLGNKRVSISLKTRCPHEALRLAKFLEYHSVELIKHMEWQGMNHAEIMAILKSYYAEMLEREKDKLDKDGPIPKEKATRIQANIEQWGEIIEAGKNDLVGLLGAEYENPEDDLMQADLQQVMAHNGLSFAPDSKEYGMMQSAYKHVKRNFMQDLLTYNSSITDFSLLNTAPANEVRNRNTKSGHTLEKVMEAYRKEIKPSLSERSYNEQCDCLNYLTDWLGADYPVAKLDDGKAREVKELLRGTPNGRNKAALTQGQALLDQITIAKAHGLPTLSITSINKYLGYFASLFTWAKRNRYVSENPFAGVRVKMERKKVRRRELFSKDEIATIIDSLGSAKLVKNESNYWGALIAIYTGARRNEIAGLLPEDVKQDADTGIWYFDINDEVEEGKEVKTEAGKRVVPVHPRLIEKGFIEFVEKSRSMRGMIKHSNGYKSRLLYDLTYTKHEKWGRNLGRWFNESYLKALGLKTSKKSLHSLRHSVITYLSMAGIEVAAIKSIVGHEPDTVTTGTYTHYGVGHLSAFQAALVKLPY